METTSKKVEDLAVGNRVDLTSCPYLKNHSSADCEYALVVYVERETPDCVVVGYEGIDHIGYQVGTVLQVRTPKDVPDPEVNVHPLGKPEEWEVWNISQNLTDRWGDINYHNADNKPLELLVDDDALFERLCAQMWDELTFIVRKDGKFGILFEAEFFSLESEEHAKDDDPDWYATLKPHAEVVKALLDGMQPLAARYPGVQFAVPDKSQVINDRPAAWAFIPDGLLSAEQREELGKALLDL
jgi:hypothetical protein